MVSPFAASSSFLTQRLSPIPAPLLGLQPHLDLLQTLHKFLLFAGRQTIPHARTGAVEKLPRDRPGCAVHLAGEDLVCQLLEAGPEPRKLARRATPPTPLAALAGRPAPVVLVVGVVRVAQAGAVDSYPSAAPASPGNCRAFAR